MRLVVKVGGAQIEEATGREDLAQAVAAARAAGHEVILVHGGGNQIRTLSKQLGLPDRYHDGLRITDAATADVVLMVLAGLVNKPLVAALEAHGVRACGLCGADGSAFTAERLRVPGVDLGYVGTIARVDARLVETLLGAGFVPVVATVAPGPDHDPGTDPRTNVPRTFLRFFNLNADTGAGPLAAAFAAEAMLFLTDVPGVLDAGKQRLPRLSPRQCRELRARGVIAGGMIPKVDAALAALAECPRATVKIAPARGSNAILEALSAAVGTQLVADTQAHSTHG